MPASQCRHLGSRLNLSHHMLAMQLFGSRQRGSSLIEVLIALGLVAVTMLGLLGMQLRTLGFQKESLDRKAAATIVAGFADRVAVNFNGFRNAGYTGLAMGPTTPTPTSATACSSTCTEVQVAARDWDLFQMEVRRRLPGGVAFVDNEGGNRNAVITVGWVDPRRNDAASGGANDLDTDNDGVHDICQAAGLNDVNYRCYSARVAP
jgi:type IV pilus modification protein PilV